MRENGTRSRSTRLRIANFKSPHCHGQPQPQLSHIYKIDTVDSCTTIIFPCAMINQEWVMCVRSIMTVAMRSLIQMTVVGSTSTTSSMRTASGQNFVLSSLATAMTGSSNSSLIPDVQAPRPYLTTSLLLFFTLLHYQSADYLAAFQLCRTTRDMDWAIFPSSLPRSSPSSSPTSPLWTMLSAWRSLIASSGMRASVELSKCAAESIR